MQKIKKILVHKTDVDGKMTEDMADVPCPPIRTHYTSKWYPKNWEINNEPSLTIPDEAMTVMEIMQRFASGLPITGGKVPYYADEDEENIDDLKKMDLAERQQIIEDKMEEIKEIAGRQQKRKDAANEFRLQKIIDQKVAARIAAKPAETSDEKPE